MNGPHELRRFGDETRPREDAAARVRSRAVANADMQAIRPVRRTPAFAMGGAFAVAAAVLAVAFGLRPAPETPLQASLEAPVDWDTYTASENVQVHFQGQGTLAGTEQAPEIAWESGTIRIAVEPDRGVDLKVLTPEVLVRVLGTRFAVKRDALGSHVEVQRGLVSVTCTDGESWELPPGRVHTCAPVTPAGLLARAQALDADAAPLETVLEALNRGLETADGPVAGELRFHRITTYASRGLFDEALETALMLDGPHAGPRRSEIGALILRLAYRVGGCAEAAQYADRAPENGPDPLDGRCN